MRKEEMTYADAISRLEEIVSRLEAGDVPVDDLSSSVKEGVRLVTWCRRKLRAAQDDVEQALQGLDPSEAEPKPARERRAAGQTTLEIGAQEEQ